MFNGGVALEFTAPVDPERLERAWRAVVDDSDALRTVFTEQDGRVQQRIREPFPVSLPVHDFCDENRPDDAASRWIDERVSQPLELAIGVFDSALLKLTGERWIWYLNVHHLVFDAWSIGVICQQASRWYGSMVTGERPEPLPQYSD